MQKKNARITKCWKLGFSDARNAFYVFIFIRNGAHYLRYFFLHPFACRANLRKMLNLLMQQPEIRTVMRKERAGRRDGNENRNRETGYLTKSVKCRRKDSEHKTILH